MKKNRRGYSRINSISRPESSSSPDGAVAGPATGSTGSTASSTSFSTALDAYNDVARYLDQQSGLGNAVPTLVHVFVDIADPGSRDKVQADLTQAASALAALPGDSNSQQVAQSVQQLQGYFQEGNANQLADSLVNSTAPDGHSAQGQVQSSNTVLPFLVGMGANAQAAFVQPRVLSDQSPTSTSHVYKLKVGSGNVDVNVDRAGQTPDGKGDVYKFQLKGRVINVTYPAGMDPINASKTVTTLGHLAKLFSVQSDEALNALSYKTVNVTGTSRGADWMTTNNNFVSIWNCDYNTDVHDDKFSFMAGSLTHEAGHAAQLDLFTPQDFAAWRQATVRDQGKVSGYADSSGQNLREDFAESWKQYLTVRGTPAESAFRKNFPERWGILDHICERVRARGFTETPPKDGAAT